MTKIRPQPGILDIALYQGGASAISGVENPLKLSSNENPFGPSPRAVAAVADTAARMHVYPSSDHASLRAVIAKRHALDESQIICGAGSDEILDFLCRSYAGAGDEVLYSEHGFSMYRIYALSAGATPVVVRERDRTVDVDALLAACTDRTRLVFVTNPGNPTGTMISTKDLERLAAGIPDQCLMVIDAAYAEYAQGYDGGASLVEARENVVMTRTFSKIHGLGGLRVGWGYGPRAVIDVLNRVRGPFNLSSVALAGAEAAIRDVDYASKCAEVNRAERLRLADGLAAMGYPSDPSHGNFILVRFAHEDEALAADAYLKANGIIARLVAGYGLPNGLRITVGTKADVTRVLEVMGRFGATR